MLPFIIQDCLICRQTSDTLICHYCHQDIIKFEPLNEDKNLLLLPHVAKNLKKINFSHLYAIGDYQWPISHLLTALKFSAKLPNALALAELFVSTHVDNHFILPQAIIPIPLHKNRFFWRKYNQSLEICRHLGKLINRPFLHRILVRKKATKAQTNLSAPQRKNNVDDAFTLAPKAIEQLSHYTHIALFDDVTTTGATVDSAYLCLQKALPALQIDIWCICLTLKH